MGMLSIPEMCRQKSRLWKFGPHSMNMAASPGARIVARHQMEPRLPEEAANQVAGAKPLGFSAIRAVIVRGNADVSCAFKSTAGSRQREALGAFDIHLQKIDAAGAPPFPDGIERHAVDGETPLGRLPFPDKARGPVRRCLDLQRTRLVRA